MLLVEDKKLIEIKVLIVCDWQRVVNSVLLC
jgi:hypothetical protein